MNVGSSSDNFDKAIPIFSCASLSFGSIATSITGSGNSIVSSIIGFSISDNVSPVVTSLNPIAAAISPANTSFNSVLLLACIWSILPTLSFLFFVAFNTYEPDSNVPEYTLKKHNLPTYGSVAILNASAENGASSDVSLSISFPSSSTPLIWSISNGDGKYSTILSNNNCNPLFLYADPQHTSVALLLNVAFLKPFLISVSVNSSPSKYFIIISSSCSAAVSTIFALYSLAFSTNSAGISFSSIILPSSSL